jgi:hypothetical protein
MSTQPRTEPAGREPFPVDDPVAGSVVSEDWGRMVENDESLEGTLADVPQTGEPVTTPPASHGNQDPDVRHS